MAPRVRSEKALAKRAKAAKISKQEFLDIRTRVTNKAADDDGWRPSERAATLADIQMAADEVWGK